MTPRAPFTMRGSSLPRPSHKKCTRARMRGVSRLVRPRCERKCQFPSRTTDIDAQSGQQRGLYTCTDVDAQCSVLM